MQLRFKYSVFVATLFLTTAFASADTIALGSWAKSDGNSGNDSSVPRVIATPSYAYSDGLMNDTVSSDPFVGTQSLSVMNAAAWSLPGGISSWVSYAQPGQESSPGVNGPDGSFFFTSTFNGLVSIVPEPSSLFLLGSGLIGSAGILLRNKRV
jgi:hypothetical protein